MWIMTIERLESNKKIKYKDFTWKEKFINVENRIIQEEF